MLKWVDLMGEAHDRVQTAIDRLRNFEPPEGYYIAFSGGKDSQCIYHLAKQAGVCPMVFGDGKHCYRETDCDRCRNNRIPADIAEKLGIKPVTPDKTVPEHDGCGGCRYFDLEEGDEPCAHCKGTAGTPEVYRARRDYFELAGGDA